MHFAGSWYPADAHGVEELLRAARRDVRVLAADHPVRFGVLPHADYRYSAPSFGAFWEEPAVMSAAATCEAIVIIAPSHYERLPPDTLVSGSFSSHETPLGPLSALEAVVPLGDVVSSHTVEREHAVELLLPAIAYYAGLSVPVGAVVVGRVSAAFAASRIAARLCKRMGTRRVLWLVSSDGSHYGARYGWQPYGTGGWKEVGRQVTLRDHALFEAALNHDERRLWKEINALSTICGRYALAIGAAIAGCRRCGVREKGKGVLLSYYSSAQVPVGDGEMKDFVCYASGVGA